MTSTIAYYEGKLQRTKDILAAIEERRQLQAKYVCQIKTEDGWLNINPASMALEIDSEAWTIVMQDVIACYCPELTEGLSVTAARSVAERLANIMIREGNVVVSWPLKIVCRISCVNSF